MAYVDPTAGSIVLQIVAAGVLTAAFTVKGWWHRVKSLARSRWDRIRRA
jgi:hypothetical protein